MKAIAVTGPHCGARLSVDDVELRQDPLSAIEARAPATGAPRWHDGRD